jgi:hypothetical protein
MQDIERIPITKIVATCLGVALCGVETWLNAEHTASSEGWGSSLVTATIIASISAAAALPIAERTWVDGQKAKAVAMCVFFMLMAGFSFSTSSGRLGGKHDAEVTTALAHNATLEIRRESLSAAKKTAEDECKVRGPRCRASEDAVQAALKALQAAPVKVTEDSAAKAIAASPLLLPLAMQLGGFVLLAYGMAPRKGIARVAHPEPIVEPISIATMDKPQALRFVLAKIRSSEKGHAPSIRALATEIGMSHSTLATWMNEWVENGALARDDKKFIIAKKVKLKIVA